MKLFTVIALGVLLGAPAMAAKPRGSMTLAAFIKAVKASPVFTNDGGDCKVEVEKDKDTYKITVSDGTQAAWVEVDGDAKITQKTKSEEDGSFQQEIYLKGLGRLVITSVDDAYDKISLVKYWHTGKKVKTYSADCEVDY